MLDTLAKRCYPIHNPPKIANKARKYKCPYNPRMKKLRNELMRQLVALGQTQRWLAEKAGVHETVVSRFLSGARSISVENAEKLLDAMEWVGVKFPKVPKE